MSLRIDATGNVRTGKAPETEYVIRWEAVQAGKIVVERKTETLKTLKNYVFRRGMDYNFAGNGTVLRAQIWRTYKNMSKCVHTYG